MKKPCLVISEHKHVKYLKVNDHLPKLQ